MVSSINVNDLNLHLFEYGKPEGFPVFHFHGFPGSHLDGFQDNFDKVAPALNVRIIAIDRPGTGGSDYKKYYKLLDWPDMVCAVADQLGIDKFSVLGTSGGGPYALAMAFRRPERLHSITVASSMVPNSFPSSRKDLSMSVPRKPAPLRKLNAFLTRRGIYNAPEKAVKAVLMMLPEPDRVFFNQDQKTQDLIRTVRESFRQGTKGYLNDAKNYKEEWGFNLRDVAIKVNLWHADQDVNVTPESARRLADELPFCNVHFIPNEAHFSMPANQMRNILEELKAG